jgi:hypothetical protein
MNVPEANHPAWRAIVTGGKRLHFEFLAAQVFMGRVGVLLAQDNSPKNVDRLINELRALFAANASHPKIQRDLANMLALTGS